MAPTKVLITGANAGLGKECARQLGMLDSIQKIYLGCRSQERAEAAKAELLEETRAATNKYEIIIMDVTDLKSIEKAVQEALPSSEEGGCIDGLVLNAGGPGSDPLGESKVKGVCNLTALNLLGHVHLVDLLISNNKLLPGNTTIVYSGSEAARGEPNYGSPKPEIDGSVDAFKSICDGSITQGNSDLLYSYVKLMAALWIGSMARKHDVDKIARFVTISPGACSGTEIFDRQPLIKRVLLKFMFQTLTWLGKGHTVEVGAKRYIDALMDDGTSYENGAFYASPDGQVTGDVVNQKDIWDFFDNTTFQDTADSVIHSFLA